MPKCATRASLRCCDVVVELAEGTEAHERVGIFKDYLVDFFEVLDVRFLHRQAVPLAPEGLKELNTLEGTLRGDIMTADNRGDLPLLVQSFRVL